MTDLGDLVYTPILSSAAVFDQYMQLGLGLGLALGLDRSMTLTWLYLQVKSMKVVCVGKLWEVCSTWELKKYFDIFTY